MNLPRRINILGFSYRIEYTNDKNRLCEGNELCSGIIRYDEQVIYIDDRICEEQQLFILLHEILHGIKRHMDFDIDNKLVDEHTLDLFANGLGSVLLNNNIKGMFDESI